MSPLRLITPPEAGVLVNIRYNGDQVSVSWLLLYNVWGCICNFDMAPYDYSFEADEQDVSANF